jgi:hypothetical protein
MPLLSPPSLLSRHPRAQTSVSPSGSAAAANAHTMKSEMSDRPSAPSTFANALGMPCALLSLASGAVSLVVAFLLWWYTFATPIKQLGEQAGVFSALLGLVLAGIGLASHRKGARRVALIAVIVNLSIVCFTADTILKFLR